MSAVLERDARFTEPLYTVLETAEYLRLPRQTLETWVKGYARERPTGKTTVGSSFIHAEPPMKGRPNIPFIGFAEAYAARALKDAGVPTAEIRRVLPMLEEEIGIEYALASRHLYVEGGRILFNYAKRSDEQQLAVVLTQQGVLNHTLEQYLQRITFDREGYAQSMVLPGTQRDVVEVDPMISYGRPVLIRGNARMVDILDRFQAGDLPREIADDFEVSEDDVTEVLRVFYCAPRD